jgi:hypothetical protein
MRDNDVEDGEESESMCIEGFKLGMETLNFP